MVTVAPIATCLVTVNEHVEVLPAPSVAVYTIVVVVAGANTDPGAGPDVLTTDAVPPQLSVDDGIPHEAVLVQADNMIFDGQAITGTVRSSIQLTDADVVVVLPQASVATNVLTCVRVQPLLVTTLVVVVTLAVPQASDAVAYPNAALMALTVGLYPNGGGAGDVVCVITGGVLSDTVIVWQAVDVLPHASIAVHVLFTEYAAPQLPVVTSL